MEYDMSALTKLKEEMRLGSNARSWAAAANEAMTPQIKMIVSNWYTDELGNQARVSFLGCLSGSPPHRSGAIAPRRARRLTVKPVP